MRHNCIILADAPAALVEVCGVSALERLLRTLQRCGLQRVTVFSATPEALAEPVPKATHRKGLAIEIVRRGSGPVRGGQILEIWPDRSERLLLLPADRILDSRLIELLDEQTATAALVDSAVPGDLQPLVGLLPATRRGRICGPALVSRRWLEDYPDEFDEALREGIEDNQIEVVDLAQRSWYARAMRRELRPYWFPVPRPAETRAAERVLVNATQKAALDFPALVHAPIENFIISRLCKAAITPNQLTLLTNLVAWTATFLFASGRLALGAVLALCVGVLDGLDGKQARVKIETSPAGKLEHWFDALFENSWWIALAWFFWRSSQLPAAFGYLAVLIAAEAVGGLAKWSVGRSCSRSIFELSQFDRFVRLVGARRNVHVWILALGMILDVPAASFVAMALWETATSAIQLLRAAWTVVFGEPLQIPAPAEEIKAALALEPTTPPVG